MTVKLKHLAAKAEYRALEPPLLLSLRRKKDLCKKADYWAQMPPRRLNRGPIVVKFLALIGRLLVSKLSILGAP